MNITEFSKTVKREYRMQKIMAKHFLKLMKSIISQIQEAQSTISTRNKKKTTERHIIIKILKTTDKEKILKWQEENNTLYKEKQK